MTGARWLAVAALLLAAMPARADYDAGMAAYGEGDHALARAEFEKVAGADARAMVALGIMAARGDGTDKDMAAAAGWFGRAAAAGDAIGQYHLARLHYSGAGVALDKARAAALFEQAAKQAHVGAIQALSLMLENGDGVPADADRAFALAKSNAEFGIPHDQLRLAAMFAEGRGTAIDMAEAYFWGQLSSRTGRVETQAIVDGYGEKLSEAERDAQDKRAAAWRPKGEYKQ